MEVHNRLWGVVHWTDRERDETVMGSTGLDGDLVQAKYVVHVKYMLCRGTDIMKDYQEFWIKSQDDSTYVWMDLHMYEFLIPG